MNEYDLVYAAGFFDGEGSVAIKQYVGKYLAYVITVRIAQSGEYGIKVCTWFRLNFKGTVHKLLQIKNYQLAYFWLLRTQQAKKFLRQIYPYLKIKKEQARLAIEFQEMSGKNKYNTHPSVVEKIEKYSYYETAKQEMHFLNGTKGK